MNPGPKPQTPYSYSPEQEREFCRLLAKHKSAIHYKIRRFPYVDNLFDHDDYYQEAVIQAYLEFHKYRPQDDADFGSWLMAITEYAVKTYRRKNFGRHSRIKVVDDLSPFDKSSDRDYTEEHIQSLLRAIDELPDHQKRDIQMHLDGVNLRQASLDEGHAAGYYSGRVSAIVKIIRDQKDRYFEGMSVDLKSLHANNGSNGRINEQAYQSKPVDQLDRNGKLIKQWPSRAEAVRSGYNQSMLYSAIKDGKAYRGYIWRYAEGQQRSGKYNTTSELLQFRHGSDN